MNIRELETRRLLLVLKSPEEVRSMLRELPTEIQREISAEWRSLVENASEANPWIHGFKLLDKVSGELLGECGFKAPPSRDGVVEIAYGVEPKHQGNGYAAEAADALTALALNEDQVSEVWAHTLPEENASTRVLIKCGFRKVGTFEDPDDGPAWRWVRKKRET